MNHGDQQALRERGEVETPVEPLGESGQIAERILGERKGMVGPTGAGLQIAEHRVDPLEFGQILGLAAADGLGLVRDLGVRSRSASCPSRVGHRRLFRADNRLPTCTRSEPLAD